MISSRDNISITTIITRIRTLYLRLQLTLKQWKLYSNILVEFGINAELEIKTDKLYTPGGYMRAKTPQTNKPTYIIKMKVVPNLQKYQFFKVLNEILSELQNITGKRAFTNFKKLNFNSLLT